MSKFELPAAPGELKGSVKAWREGVVIPTYEPAAADKNPMFLEKRVYQGSSGRVYPLPIVDRISETKINKKWDAIHIENEFVRVMILPELGGRIHVGMDKTNGYDFFYRQNVIKPAPVGLAGPWASGGVEFNWPQHHRPSTFMPTEVEIEKHVDGSVTVWCSEHEPMNRMKGMHGVCLHPGSSVVELKARIYNRTELVQTFLWWANVATRVHELYQSFFPPDVSYVADHAKRAMSRFPGCEGMYYGVDYGMRAKNGVAAGDAPRQFIPPGNYAANDLSWYANIPVPTSYMAMGSRADFMGGYDHKARAGLVHVADRHIAPGKKQWTWGNHEFGYAWDRNLTDEDGPYIELMAGVYTDNQPDFSFLHPGETRTWSQYWYPIREIGPAQAANKEAALSVMVREGKVRVGVAVTSVRAGVNIEVMGNEEVVDLSPDKPFVKEFAAKEDKVRVVVSHGEKELVRYEVEEKKKAEVPAAAKEPGLPEEVKSQEELYLIGLHLEQYRHATRSGEAYWREAVRRDPMDSRCLVALGVWHLRRGEFEKAAGCLEKAIASLTRFNPNPAEGEAFYYLGITLRYLGRNEGAYDVLYKATWNYAWQSAGFFALAQMDCVVAEWEKALEHLERVLRVNAEHLQARVLKVLVSRKLGREAEAGEVLRGTLALDRLDPISRWVETGELMGDAAIGLDVAFDLARAGFLREAVGVLEKVEGPMAGYAKAYYLERLGDDAGAKRVREKAAKISPDYCFPARVEEIGILEQAIAKEPNDARARYYLGNLFYDRRRHEEGIQLWEEAARLEPAYAITWRNLGIGKLNVRKDANGALEAYERAARANPDDARLAYERDQLWKRIGESPAKRLAELEKHRELVGKRDDLSIELCTLLNQIGEPEKALEVLRSRRFQPWEGGEGLALGQHVRTHLLLARKAMVEGKGKLARELMDAALEVPEGLGEAKHLLMNQSDVHYQLGRLCENVDDTEAAKRHYLLAAEARGDFQQMVVRHFSEMTYYSAMALRALERFGEAEKLLKDLLQYAHELEKTPAKIDYFATSLPTLILFEDDLQRRQEMQARFMMAQALLGLGNAVETEGILRGLLEEDPNHAMAMDLLAEMRTAIAPVAK